MAETDSLLKRLVSTFILDFATWLLRAHVRAARPLQVEDTGIYHVEGLDGTPVLTWRYRVMRLWQMSAEELLTSEPVAPLTLVGQTQIAQPEVLLPTVVTRLRQVADLGLRSRLFTALLALLPAEEMVTMVERLLEHDDVVMELPYLRRIREEGRQEGHQEGRREGEAEMLLRQLHIRFGTLSTATVARVHEADPETLLHWSERVLSAATLDEVFAA